MNVGNLYSHITESYYGFMIIVEQLELASHYVSAMIAIVTVEKA